MIKVVILGAGNVALQLHNALAKNKEVRVIQGYNRSWSNSLEQCNIPQTQQLHELKLADIYIIAISDDAIETITSRLPFENRLVVHTSGSTPMRQISNKNRQGVFYPLQTFSATVPADFTIIPICLETAHPEDMPILKQLASAITTKIYHISSQQRNILHVAAVFANNFSNLMYTEAKKLCDIHQIPFEILHPLITETATKILTLDPITAQTGPARRNDNKTIHRHIDTLKEDKQKELYKLLTDTIKKHHGKKL